MHLQTAYYYSDHFPTLVARSAFLEIFKGAGKIIKKKYSVFNGSNYKFYLNFLVEISTINFLLTHLNFQKKVAIFGFYSKLH